MSTEARPVGVFNEWGKLREVLVGDSARDTLPRWSPDWGRYHGFKEMMTGLEGVRFRQAFPECRDHRCGAQTAHQRNREAWGIGRRRTLRQTLRAWRRHPLLNAPAASGTLRATGRSAKAQICHQYLAGIVER